VTYTRGNDLSGSLQEAGGIGGLLARTDNRQLIAGDVSAHAYYHADGNANITALVNSNQMVVARYHYDPYGNTLAAIGPLTEANLYRFSSKELHPNSGLVYYLYRYYEPNLQRWVNRDPIGEASGKNLYVHVANSPLNHIDMFGLEIRCPTPEERQQTDDVINGLASHDVRVLQRESLELKGREYKIDTDLCSPKAIRVLGYVEKKKDSTNTIYLSPDLFRGSSNAVATHLLPTQEGNYNVRAWLMRVMIHENQHLNNYNPWAGPFWWFQRDNVHDWIDTYVDNIEKMMQLNKTKDVPAPPPLEG